MMMPLMTFGRKNSERATLRARTFRPSSISAAASAKLLTKIRLPKPSLIVKPMEFRKT